MGEHRSYRFSHALLRTPAKSCVDGLRSDYAAIPSVDTFRREHEGYLEALRNAGVETVVLPPLESFPDSVFVEDAALCVPGAAVVLRPGATERARESDAIAPDLERVFDGRVDRLPAGTVDGGDVLLTDDDAFIGLSARTDATGAEGLGEWLERHDYTPRIVETPETVLHLKSDCALLDSDTLLATPGLSASRCFGSRYRVLETPPGEEAAANLIRVNDHVLVRAGFPKTKALLEAEGFRVVCVEANEAAKLDGGLSCMSLRFRHG